MLILIGVLVKINFNLLLDNQKVLCALGLQQYYFILTCTVFYLHNSLIKLFETDFTLIIPVKIFSKIRAIYTL